MSNSLPPFQFGAIYYSTDCGSRIPDLSVAFVVIPGLSENRTCTVSYYNTTVSTRIELAASAAKNKFP